MLRIPSDRETEHCGKVEQYGYQLFLAVKNIDHTKTNARDPQTNGIVERLHKTFLHEFARRYSARRFMLDKKITEKVFENEIIN